jgi:uncharacterized protein YggT (Ycf19 family)
MDRKTKRTILWIGRVVVLVVYLVVLAYAVILGIAFVLRLLGANPDADFAEWIYRAAGRIMEPFRGIFPTQQINDTSVFDASLLFALIVYLVVGVVLHGIVDWFARRIAGLDRAEEQERLFAAYDAQERAALGYGTVPAVDQPTVVPPAPGTVPGAYPWDQPAGAPGTTGTAPDTTPAPPPPNDYPAPPA